jgi:hypothetical protein
MSESRKTPAPLDRAAARAGDDESSVRPRADSQVKRRGSGEYAATSPAGSERPRDPSKETISERTNRIDAKLSVAALLLERLSPLDARARLLGSAILRRDEVLLDAILAEMTEEVVALAASRRSR